MQAARELSDADHSARISAFPGQLARAALRHATSGDGPLFVNEAQRAELTSALQGVLLVRLSLDASLRGQLGERLRVAVCEHLARVGLELQLGDGAEPVPTFHALAELVHEATGSRVLLSLEGLSSLAGEGDRLDGEDSLALRELLQSPVRLLLDAGDQALQVFCAPVSLGQLAGGVSVPAPRGPSLHELARDVLGAQREEPAPPSEPAPARSSVLPPPTTRGLRAAMAGLFSDSEPAQARAAREPAGDDLAWLQHVSALESARGPQSLQALEHLFLHHYLPLGQMLMQSAELRRGDSQARRVFEEFRGNFARVYTEASHAFAVRSKRPKMVLDAWNCASKWARTHNARAVMLLVDGMRYDIACRVHEQLQLRMQQVGQDTLCAALPATTARQLELLRLGPEGLAQEHEPPSLEEVLRERTADAVRRVRSGSRELYKLDWVESRLRGNVSLAEIEQVALQTADTIERFVREHEPARRNVFYVFGDHGFPFGAGSMEQRGAFPEQVFVSGVAYLVDGSA